MTRGQGGACHQGSPAARRVSANWTGSHQPCRPGPRYERSAMRVLLLATVNRIAATPLPMIRSRLDPFLANHVVRRCSSEAKLPASQMALSNLVLQRKRLNPWWQRPEASRPYRRVGSIAAADAPRLLYPAPSDGWIPARWSSQRAETRRCEVSTALPTATSPVRRRGPQ